MARAYNKKSDTNKPYKLDYTDPTTGKRKRVGFKVKAQRDEEHLRWELIETYFKNNNPQWRKLYEENNTMYTIAEVFEAYRNNVLVNKASQLTINKYETVMKSFTEIIPDSTPVDKIRSLKRQMGIKKHAKDDGYRQGWEIYKTHREMAGRARQGINSYLRDLRNIFMWAMQAGGSNGTGMVTFEILTKQDKYNAAEVNPIKIKIWTDKEITTLKQCDLTELERDIVTIYRVTGFRAKEVIGRNYLNRAKELKWHHIDFENNKMHILEKRGKIRTEKYMDPEVRAIFRKYFLAGHDRPLDIGYDKLNSIIKSVNKKTRIAFTCHDLRRLKAQLAERDSVKNNAAGTAIGDSTESVVTTHYAPESIHSQRMVNEQIRATYNHITRGEA
nr:site-specific recombinase XerD [uncultured Mediterranean phage uvMED]